MMTIGKVVMLKRTKKSKSTNNLKNLDPLYQVSGGIVKKTASYSSGLCYLAEQLEKQHHEHVPQLFPRIHYQTEIGLQVSEISDLFSAFTLKKETNENNQLPVSASTLLKKHKY